jgi:hypothetical protein
LNVVCLLTNLYYFVIDTMSPITDALAHPAELLAMLNYKFLRPSAVINPAVIADGTIASKARFVCYSLLNRTSRSLSAVIKELNEELMDPVGHIRIN